jgi:hypothetical protein
MVTVKTKSDVVAILEAAGLPKGSGCFFDYGRAKELFQHWVLSPDEYGELIDIIVDYLEV